MRGPRQGIAVVVCAGLALGACRGERSSSPPVHVNPNMDDQAYLQAQEPCPLFGDQRAMRPQVAHTIARGELRDAEHFHRGTRRGKPATDLALRLDRGVIARGRQRFDIYCAACHGLTGEGRDSPMRRTVNPMLVPPPSYLEPRLRALPAGGIFAVISDGLRNMPPYRERIAPADRWAIVAYVRVLQIAGSAGLERVPPAVARQKGWSR